MDAMNTYKSNWIDSVITYLKESQASCLDLKHGNLKTEEVEAFLKYLPGSQIDKLCLSWNKLKNKMQALSEVLIKSGITKLDVSGCQLTKHDIAQLMKVLKFTKITALDIRSNAFDDITSDDRDKFISHLLESHLKILKFTQHKFEKVGLEPLIQALLNSKITKLDLSRLNHDTLVVLISNLHHSSLTELSLRQSEFDEGTLKALSQAIRRSGLKKLDLTGDGLNDDAVDILVEGLVHSEITQLDLWKNKICGSNTLGLRLKDTPIKILKLNDNPLKQQGIFLCSDFLKSSSLVTLEIKYCCVGDEFFRKLMRCLKFSKVKELKADDNNLGLPAISEFAKVLKDTDLERVCLAGNYYLPQEALVLLAEGITGSKLKHIDLNSCFEYEDAGIHLPLFITKTKSSNLDSFEIDGCPLKEAAAETLAVHLENTKLTKLSLASTEIGNGVSSLAKHLKFTVLSHLDLSFCQITDGGAKTLAKHLKETQLTELRLNDNEISCHGAEALALSLKDSSLLRLNLNWNPIKTSGCRALAQGAENTFITALDIVPQAHNDSNNSSKEFFCIDAVLWRNKISVYRLINTFKQIAPQVGNSNFCFTRNNVSCASDFFKNCLELYMNIIQKPAAIKVLMEDKSVGFSRKQIVALMEEEFPNQFCLFIASRVDANIEDHIGLLKMAEEWNLNKVVDFLLLNRPLYLIDRDSGIFHPYFYKLLHKYNHPVYNLAVEPEGKTKILSYFTDRGDIDGAADVIRLLHRKRKQ